MNTSTLETLAASLAAFDGINDNARVYSFTGQRPRSMKDLLCDACGVNEATHEGYCDGCNKELCAVIDEARYLHVGDDEGENFLSGHPSRDF